MAGRAERLARLQRAEALLQAEAAARQQRHQQWVAELAAARARGQRPRAHIRPRRRDEAPNPTATANTTDPDSRFLRGSRLASRGALRASSPTAPALLAALGDQDSAR